MTFDGVAAVAAGITLAVSGACLMAFFATEIEVWGRINDATTALFAALLIPAALGALERFGDSSWLRSATYLGIAGMVVVVVTSGLTAAGKLDWLVSAKIGGVGFAAMLVWMAAVCVAILQRGGAPDALAWLGLVGIVFAGVGAVLAIRFVRAHGSFTGAVQPPASLSVTFGLGFLCLLGWTVWLGFSLG